MLHQTAFPRATDQISAQQPNFKSQATNFRSDRFISHHPELVIIDSGVNDYQLLVAGVKPNCEVIVLHPHQDGIEQITEYLTSTANSQHPTPIHTLHIISHGSPGTLYLGNSILNSETLQTRYSKAVPQWRHALADNAHILIYGCNVAASKGQAEAHCPYSPPTPYTLHPTPQLLKQLHFLTGAQIYANSQPTGNSAKGGTWNLQPLNSTLPQPPTVPFSPQTLITYPHTLNFIDSPPPAIPAQILAASQTIEFADQATFAVGADPYSIAVADVNGDGNLDVITGNFSDNNVSVILGDGSGSFSQQKTFAVQTKPAYVAVADFDEDGNVDLAVGNFGSDSLSVLRGDGSGNFGTQTTLAAGTNPHCLVVADFNGDANLDLAMGNYGGKEVSVLIGDGSGSFRETTFPTQDGSIALDVGDLDGDGQWDLAITNYRSNTISVLLGDGSGNFDPQIIYAAGTNPISVSMEDLNEDGNLDLAVANRTSNNISVFIGDGYGNFSPQTTYAAGDGPFTVEIEDFNDDGNLDLAVANQRSNNISLFHGDGSGKFEPQITFAAGDGPTHVVLGDFNGDGKPDLVTSNNASNNVSVFLNK